ncbi:tail assembly chaperone [Cytobacillus horneckiae]|uniref:tail assembly chaperone n=1 Tax=Cytobacillus horneckiae TaxID=549687 RepID=UPI0019D09E69|nr:tail assembly chaperone [Cytobacillus horneckiae]MBN6890084.1 tail assembly chaperone [Cytobacillus horneckiae]
MEFKINEKMYQLKFGIKCIRELDKFYKVDYQGMEFGMGVNLAFMNLNQYNPTALAQVITAAIAHEPSPPKIYQIDTAIEEYAVENDGLKSLFEEVLDELGKSPVAKDTLKTFKEKGKVDPEQEAQENQ